MPFYQQIVTLKPRTNPVDITRIFRKLASNILMQGGMVRAVTNHGVRVLPYRFHSKYIVSETESRWFSSGRWVSAYFDVHPDVAKRCEELLFDEDTVLRVSTLRPRTKMDAMRSTHLKSNPWEIERAKRLGIPIDSKCYTPGPNASIGSNTRRIGSA